MVGTIECVYSDYVKSENSERLANTKRVSKVSRPIFCLVCYARLNLSEFKNF